MTTTPRQRRGRGRPSVHDPDLIRQLLKEREDTGETFVELETRSGIPAGTLSGHSRRQRRRHARTSGFVELVVTRDQPESRTREPFEVAVSSPRGLRHVLVPAGFDASELQRLLAVLEQC